MEKAARQCGALPDERPLIEGIDTIGTHGKNDLTGFTRKEKSVLVAALECGTFTIIRWVGQWVRSALGCSPGPEAH
jgi:hypothetical protein